LFTDKRISLDEEEGEQESLQFEQQTGKFLRRKAVGWNTIPALVANQSFNNTISID